MHLVVVLIAHYVITIIILVTHRGTGLYAASSNKEKSKLREIKGTCTFLSFIQGKEEIDTLSQI